MGLIFQLAVQSVFDIRYCMKTMRIQIMGKSLTIKTSGGLEPSRGF